MATITPEFQEKPRHHLVGFFYIINILIPSDHLNKYITWDIYATDGLHPFLSFFLLFQ